VRLLFTSGTARGGTNFRTLILNNHGRVRLSLDPFIPLFRFYRDTLLRAAGLEHLLARLPSAVLDDYYFSETKLQIMKAVRSADPDVPFDLSQWERLKLAIASRMTLASMDVIPYLDILPAPTFREVFRNAMQAIAATTDKQLVWAGFNDNWAMEFIPLLARLDSEAKFMVHLRDPRAVVHSSEFAEPEPAKRPTILSLARHLRKYYAFATVLPEDPYLHGRLMITRYEPFVEQPDVETGIVTEFLGIEYDPAMIEVDSFRKADGTPWPSVWSDYRASVGAWRRELPRPMAELTEFVCDPEMRLFGYGPEYYDAASGLSPAAFNFALANSRDCRGWRTDFPEIERTLGSELFRKRVIASPGEASGADIERMFLFPLVFDRIRAL
jgi:hypothetical protein